jgi:hypothetical protein
LNDERWAAMTFEDQNDLIRSEAIDFLTFNTVCDLNDRGGVN